MMKSTEKVTCRICGDDGHFLEVHLGREHGLRVAEYLDMHPGAQVMSEAAKTYLEQIEAQAWNEKVPMSVKRLFGVSVNDDMGETLGFKAPHRTTPEVDPDYKFRKDLLAAVLFVAENPNERALFTGPTGSGKSSVVEQVAARLNMPWYRVNFDGDMSRSDFVGQWVLKGEEMQFQYGVLPRAMKDGAWLCLDEWDCANPSVAMALQAVLEGKPLTLTETNEVIRAHPNFRLFATSNTLGQGDGGGLYNGTQPQNFAALDRFTIVLTVDYPAPADEKKIMTAKTGEANQEVLKKYLDVAKLVREAFKKEEVMTTMSTRTLVNIAGKLKVFGNVKAAYELAYLNKLAKDDRKFVEEIVQRVWG